MAGREADDPRYTVRFDEVAHRVDLQALGGGVDFGQPLGQFGLAHTVQAAEEHHRGGLAGVGDAGFNQPQFAGDGGDRLFLAYDSRAEDLLVVGVVDVSGESLAGDAADGGVDPDDEV